MSIENEISFKVEAVLYESNLQIVECNIKYAPNSEWEVFLAIISSSLSEIIKADISYPLTLLDDLGRAINNEAELLQSTAIFAFPSSLPSTYCTASLLPTMSILQPKYRFMDTSLSLCGVCQAFVDPSLLSTITSSLDLTPFRCERQQLEEMGMIPAASQMVPALPEASPFPLYCQRLFFSFAVDQQAASLPIDHLQGPSYAAFERRLAGLAKTVNAWEDREAQQAVRQLLDYPAIYSHYLHYSHHPTFRPPYRCEEEPLVRALMHWFKQDFFSWCNKPDCDTVSCPGRGSSDLTSHPQQPTAVPTSVEASWEGGGASRVEVYACRLCGGTTRFPRYNNPLFMLRHSRLGRCGEFANVFGMICRSLGLDVCYVLDFTDHVWLELYGTRTDRGGGPRGGVWLHVDVCEGNNGFSSPLGYEQGWKKQLSVVVNCGRYGTADSLARYSRSLGEGIVRRNRDVVAEASSRRLLERYHHLQVDRQRGRGGSINNNNHPTVAQRHRSTAHWTEIVAAMRTNDHSGSYLLGEVADEVEVEEEQRRWRELCRELEGLAFLPLQQTGLRPEEQQGRSSGDEAWRRERGELGGGGGTGGGASSSSAGATAAAAVEEEEEREEAVATEGREEQQEEDEEEEGAAAAALLQGLMLFPPLSQQQQLSYRLSFAFRSASSSVSTIENNNKHLAALLSLPSPSVEGKAKVPPPIIVNINGLKIALQSVITSSSSSSSPAAVSMSVGGGRYRLACLDVCRGATYHGETARRYLDNNHHSADDDLLLLVVVHALYPAAQSSDNNHNRHRREELRSFLSSLSIVLPAEDKDSQGQEDRKEGQEEEEEVFVLASLGQEGGQGQEKRKVEVYSSRDPRYLLALAKETRGEGTGEGEKKEVAVVQQVSPCLLTAIISFSSTSSTSSSTSSPPPPALPAVSWRRFDQTLCRQMTEIRLLSPPLPPAPPVSSSAAAASSLPSTMTGGEEVGEVILSSLQEHCLQHGYLGFSLLSSSPASYPSAALFFLLSDSLPVSAGAAPIMTTGGRAILLPFLQSCLMSTSYLPSYPLLLSSEPSSSLPSTTTSPVSSHVCSSPFTTFASYPLAGGHHGDTSYFTTLDALLSLLSSSPSSCPRLQEVVVMAGEQLVNGLQVTYRDDDRQEGQSTRCSPLFSSPGGSPVLVQASCPCSIGRLVVRAGDLIDRLELYDQSNQLLLAAGGSGGQRCEVFFLQQEKEREVVGFIGGCGGHLHNLGVILRIGSDKEGERKEGGDRQEAINQVVFIAEEEGIKTVKRQQLWSLCEKHGLSGSVGLFSTAIQQRAGGGLASRQGEGFAHHNDLGCLVDHLVPLLVHAAANPEQQATIKAGLQAILAYFQKIQQHPTEEKYQRIKLTNAYLHSKVLFSLPATSPSTSSTAVIAQPALALLTYGPTAFHLASDGQFLESQLRNWMIPGAKLPAGAGNAINRKDVLRWLGKYVDFLQDVIATL